MNDIQDKENIYTTATTAVIKRQESLSAATEQVTQIKEEYLRNVVHTAVLSEKVRRKKDALSKVTVFGGLGIISLILFLLNDVGSIIFIAVFAGIVWIVKKQRAEATATSYYFRKMFFSKYAYAVPANEQLKWKDGPEIQGNNTSDSADH